MLCQYRNIFGKPRQGAHAMRIPVLDWALVDTALTVLAAALVTWLSGASFWLVLLVLFIVAIALHWLFCVPTRLNQQLGIAPAQ